MLFVSPSLSLSRSLFRFFVVFFLNAWLQVDSFPGLGKEMAAGRDFSAENRPALDDIYGVKSGGGAKSAAA